MTAWRLNTTDARRFWRDSWPAITAIVVLWIVVAVFIAQIVRTNDGRYVYPLDDTYIHLSIAKNLSQHGVWGVTPYETSSASSSILWPLLLAGLFTLGGVSEYAPLALNVVLAGVLLIILNRFLHRDLQTGARLRCVVLLLFIPLLALPLLVLNGMEHVLQTMAAVLTVIVGVRLASSDRAASRRQLVGLAFLGMFVTATRYEGLFVALSVALILFVRKRYVASFVLVLGAAFPVILFGWYSVLHGQMFFPNSIVIKSPWAGVTGVDSAVTLFFRRLIELAGAKPYLVLLIGMLAWGVLRQHEQKSLALLSKLALLVVVLHTTLAASPWDYRHDISAITIGLLAAVSIRPHGVSFPSGRRAALRASLVLGGTILFAATLVARNTTYGAWLAPSTREIYEQHIQLTTFFARYYPGATVAANDIGALTFFGDVRLFDVYGLASPNVAQERRRRDYTVADVERFAAARDVEVAFVYDAWFAAGLLPRPAPPTSWIPVGQWASRTDYVVGARVVSFYAVSPHAKDRLIRNLQEFSGELPTTVQQGGEYLGRAALYE